ncbi:MAG: 3-deoxy-D-manno-octulosonic acid transferase [Pseudomonadota bacterium]
MRPPPSLRLYLAAARAAGPLMRPLLARRAARGKEDPARLEERLGLASLPRPPGPLAWFHAASVGESLSVLPLIAALRAARPDATPLLTTGTRTAAGLAAERLPDGALHQFAPVDGGAGPRRFAAHWRPDLAVWVESEIWPALVHAAAEGGARMAMVNARMSERSAARWAKAPAMIAALLGRFEVVLTQDEAAAARLRTLGARGAVAAGSLKAGAAPPDRPAAREALAAACAGRPIWLAASTHVGEEAAVAEAHRATGLLGLLTLAAPRHPERGAEVAALFQAAGLTVTRRSQGETPGSDTEVHVLDTLGEMGAWYRLAPAAFLGASLVPLGGHNPHEPAALGCAVLHGPHTENFAEDFAALAAAGGAVQVNGGAGIGREVAALLRDAPRREAMARAAAEALGDGRAALDRALTTLLAMLPEARA